MTIYSEECRQGREAAAELLRSIAGDGDRLPELVRAIRDAAADESGRGVGFLFVIAQTAVRL
mgnify:CR=1 FL=1